MKRVIFILFGLVITIVLLDRVLERKRETQPAAVTSGSSNVVESRIFPKRSPRAIELQQNAEVDSSSIHEDDGDEWEKLSREQVEAYLLKTKRSPESLLNAFIETGDTNFLAEAVEKHSDNPLVQWTMLNQKTSPEEREQWLEKLKATSPDNALPNYLSALDKLKAGNTEQALAEIDAASGKTAVSAFELERMQSREEMYLLAGCSPLEAKSKGMETLLLPNLAEMKSLAQEVSALQQQYKAAGDNASVEQLAALGVEIGSKVADPKSSRILINQLVGYAMENIALKNLDAGTYYEFLRKTPGQRLQEIKNQKQELKALMPVWTTHFPRLNDVEKMIFLDRSRLYGELNAMKWLKNYAAE